MKEQCLIDSTHQGPFARYMWLERASSRYPHQGLLCEGCAEKTGAWMLPVKLTNVYPDLLTKEDSKHGNISQR